jgi:hypothetical protein
MFFGFSGNPYPFGDLSYVLSAMECTRAGVDVIIENPCDVRGRRFIYPPAWLDLSFLPLDSGDTVRLGVLLLTAYVAVTACVLRPHGIIGWGLGILLVLSPSSVYLMERGNVDAILFILAVAAVWLSTLRHETWRLVAMSLAALSSLLKVYPVVLFSTLLPSLRTSSRKALVYFVLLATVGLAYVSLQWFEIERFIGGVPFQKSLAMFGADIVPWSVEIVSGVTLPGILHEKFSIVALFVATAGTVYLLPGSAPLPCGARGDLTPNAKLFVVGGAVVIFCYLVGINVAYRLVYVILMVPYLLEMAASPRPLSQRIAAILILAWAVLCTWNLKIIGMLVEHFAGLESMLQILEFKPWLDAYILFYQLGTWAILAVVLVNICALLAGVHARPGKGSRGQQA